MSSPAEKTIEDDDKDIPVAQAMIAAAPPSNALVPVSGSNSTTYTMIDIPIDSAAFQLTGFPVKLGEALDKDVVLPAGVNSNWYVHSIQILPDLEVTHLVNAESCNKILQSNKHLHRKLGVGRDAPTQQQQNDGFYYTHTLPTPANLDALQLKLDGFPPRVVSVSDQSPLAGKIHARQVVVELRIPSKQTINAQTGGFTGFKVQQELLASSDVKGIRLTVKDELNVVKKEKGSNAAFDDCTIM